MKRITVQVCIAAAVVMLASASFMVVVRAQPADTDYPVVVGQVLCDGVDTVPYPTAVQPLLSALTARTSIHAGPVPDTVRIGKDDIFHYPLLYFAGRSAFAPWSERVRAELRRYLRFGGTLLIDDASGIAASDFDTSIRREMAAIFPDTPLERLSADHTIYRSFYLFRARGQSTPAIGGRVLIVPYLEGVSVGDRTPVLYARNDLGGAWAADLLGNPLYRPAPGGRSQREDAIRLGINTVMYALTINYKKDAIHAETILKRRRMR